MVDEMKHLVGIPVSVRAEVIAFICQNYPGIASILPGLPKFLGNCV